MRVRFALELCGGPEFSEPSCCEDLAKYGTTVIAFVEDPDGYKIELIQR